MVSVTDSDIKSTTISLADVINAGGRLKASVFNIEAHQIKELIQNLQWDKKTLAGMVNACFYPGRFKRNYLKKGIGFLGSAEMLNILPEPVKFMSIDPNVAVKEGQILLSRSGTIGNVAYVGKTLSNFLVSEHAIRIEAKEYPGYLYTFLKTNAGRILIKAGIHGAVVSQLEPEHILNIIIPVASNNLVQKINDDILKSYQLRDESNDLILKARRELLEELKLEELEEINKKLTENGLACYSTRLSDLDNRLDASYHNPVATSIIQQLKKNSHKLVKIKNQTISSDIILPGRFKRIYVDEKYGVPFLGGKQIGTLDPRTGKNLSLQNHGKRIKEQLTIHQNQVMITCSGTIGRVNIAPKHWDGWASSQHIIRINATSDFIAGYLYTWLSTSYGHELVKRFVYGSVVDEIDDGHVGNVIVPLLNEDKLKSIGGKVLKANIKRYEAYTIEERAIYTFNSDVLGISE